MVFYLYQFEGVTKPVGTKPVSGSLRKDDCYYALEVGVGFIAGVIAVW